MDRARTNQDSYDRVVDRYLDRSRDRSLLRPWMQRFKEQLPSAAPVLDLGAGPCLDSAELRSLGLRVISVDRPDAPRWFTYWSEDDLDASLRSAGFEILESATQAGLHDRWITRIARRS